MAALHDMKISGHGVLFHHKVLVTFSGCLNFYVHLTWSQQGAYMKHTEWETGGQQGPQLQIFALGHQPWTTSLFKAWNRVNLIRMIIIFRMCPLFNYHTLAAVRGQKMCYWKILMVSRSKPNRTRCSIQTRPGPVTEQEEKIKSTFSLL